MYPDSSFDSRHLWHPYAAPGELPAALKVVSASGTKIRLEDGRELYDGMASWWSAIHGYNHPVLNRAATEQLGRMSHIMFGGLTHSPAIELGHTLLDLCGGDYTQVFFCDSGSVATEVAIKMALQYWQGHNQPQRQRLLTIRGGYHGDTFGAMAVCDPGDGMHSHFSDIIPRHFFAPRPECRFGEPCNPADTAEFVTLLERHQAQLAAVILEPIVQGAGGMWFYSADWLAQVRHLCTEMEIPLIADEIATGFGRSGTMFACEHAGITADILCLGKALTGGYLSAAAVLTTDEIAAGITASEPGALMHGPTFMANPLACAIAGASIRLLRENPWQQQVAAIEQGLLSGLEPARELPQVADVRCLGAIGVIELKQPVARQAVRDKLLEYGVWLRPFGKLLYTMPPYITSAEELQQLTSAMCAAAAIADSDD